MRHKGAKDPPEKKMHQPGCAKNRKRGVRLRTGFTPTGARERHTRPRAREQGLTPVAGPGRADPKSLSPLYTHAHTRLQGAVEGKNPPNIALVRSNHTRA